MPDDNDLPNTGSEQQNPDNVLPTAGSEQTGETDRIAEDEAAYQASPNKGHQDGDHALGGSEGTTEGQ